MTKDTDSGNAGHTGDMATPKPTRPRISTPKSTGIHNQIRLGGSGLSACSTGWRPTQVADIELAADSAVGLVASFLAAGASTVIASLTQVDDSVAPEIFNRYHEHRLAGLPPAAALCTTQAALLEEGNLEPAHLVGFTAFGR